MGVLQRSLAVSPSALKANVDAASSLTSPAAIMNALSTEGNLELNGSGMLELGDSESSMSLGALLGMVKYYSFESHSSQPQLEVGEAVFPTTMKILPDPSLKLPPEEREEWRARRIEMIFAANKAGKFIGDNLESVGVVPSGKLGSTLCTNA